MPPRRGSTLTTVAHERGDVPAHACLYCTACGAFPRCLFGLEVHEADCPSRAPDARLSTFPSP